MLFVLLMVVISFQTGNHAWSYTALGLLGLTNLINASGAAKEKSKTKTLDQQLKSAVDKFIEDVRKQEK